MRKFHIANLALFIIFSLNVLSQNISFEVIDSKTYSSFRALSVVDDQVMWVSGSNGWYGRSKDGGKTWDFDQFSLFKDQDFRTLYAFDFNHAIIANAGSPAYILRTTDGGENWIPVYQNSDPAIFLDGIDFWDKNNGIIYGDPIQGKMTLLRTEDGGFTWQPLSSDQRPAMKDGEASFAASGTAIRCASHSKLFIASGGEVSRIFFSEDRGFTWQVIECPILQGTASTGIFSLAVEEENLVVVGGDYTREDEGVDHVFISKNEGKKWEKPEVSPAGYRESVEFLTKDFIICTGPSGTEISDDGGQNWKSIQGREGMHVVRKAREGNLVVMAGREGIIMLLK